MSSTVYARLFVFLLLISLGRLCSADTILVVGDSLSAGYGLPHDTSWVKLLERQLADEKQTLSIINASISGETTDGGKRRIEDLLLRHQPTVVIVELGANDGMRGARIPLIRDNLSAIVDLCRKHKAKVLVIGMRIPPNYGRSYEEQFRAIFSEVADRHDAVLVPFMLAGFADNPSLFQDDGIHPTVDAQHLILKNIYRHLKPLL